MGLTQGIAKARDYGELARALFTEMSSAGKIQQVAVCDSIGLWHVYPDRKIYPVARNFKTAFGKRVLLRLSGATRLPAGKKITGIAEITQVKLEALDLREKLRRLEIVASAEMNEAKRRDREQRRSLKRTADDKLRFFSTYSHDIKTPLSLLTMPLESLVVNDDRLPPPLRLQLEKIKVAIYNVLRTVGHSLDAARLMTKNRRGILLPYNFSAFVRQVAEVYAIVFESYGMALQTHIEDAIVAEIDPIQMEKVINNLLSNSIKHNLPGGITHITLSAEPGKARLTIADDGLGSSQAALKQSISNSNPWVFASHGYGLGIVRELLRLNRARLSIGSKQGSGNTVTITLPAIAEMQQAADGLRTHNFYYTMHEVELLASERTQLSRRKQSR
ncbi:sensor histidine kinase [Turneriella parva]|uniref:histidine kinase n=1 Tax=Turneriella parva (strain ATCC BAA-1111 / DSM 21527 / NCTC 11395 / H) TaxID=869212 RepID=I4B8P7_TURPD|nr:HAMP domain-containing sensor histidine kinase [Turneriella parva]AFM13654.1 histidine kinase [Turneriella parva DSM 21527]